MSEPPPVEPAAAPLRQAAPVEHPAAGVALRVDQPHAVHDALPAGQSAPGDVSRQQAFPARRVSVETAAGIDVRLVAPLERVAADGREDGDRFALETGQIAAHLREQYADLDRREQRLHIQLAQVDQERREQRLWAADLEARLEEREFAIARQEAALSQRADACLKLEAELKELHETLLRERHSLSVEREQLIHDRDEQEKGLEGMRARAQQDLERLRADLVAEHDEAENTLRHERVLLENRQRFQQEHLTRTMNEFEKTQDEFRREQQQLRNRHEETQSQIVLRSRQLDRQRDLLDERQQSVERERELLFKERRAIEERLEAESAELRRDRTTWEGDRESQKADLRRQQDMLTLHAESLETRRQRLDRLRAELEETNRQTLELRLAVEEASAQLMQTAGSEATRQRIDEARAILAEYYRHTRESLMQQRQEVEQAQLRLHQQREEFKAERQLLVQWISAQEEQLAGRERNLHSERDVLEAREAARQKAAERWTTEKLEAESVIRDLLRQLGEREGS